MDKLEYSIDDLLDKIDANTINLTPEDRKSILQKNAKAMFELGKQYYNSADYKTAVEWYTRAAHAEYPEAQIELGQMYFHGQGVAANFIRSYNWYIKQVDNPMVQYHLGIMYEQGDSLMYINKARAWFEHSAEGGNTEGQYMAGVMNAHLSYDPKYKPRAIKYLTIATKNGHEKAITALKGFVLLLGNEEVESYQKASGIEPMKKPKKTMSDEYLRLLQTKVEMYRTPKAYSPTVTQPIEPVKRSKKQVNGVIKVGIKDLEHNIESLSEAEETEYLNLMKKKAKKEELIKKLKADLMGFDDADFELVYRQKENEKIRQRIRKMEDLFSELATVCNPKRAIMNGEHDDYPSKKPHL